MATVNKRADNGKWEVRYFDAGGHRRSKSGFDRKKDAEAYKRKVEGEIDAGTHIAPRESATVGEALDGYLASLDQQVKAGTWRESSYFREDQFLRLHIRPNFGALRICDLKAAEVSRLIFDLRAGKRSAKRPLAPVTVGHVMNAFARAMDYAVRQRMARENVVRIAKRWKEHRFKKEPIRLFRLEECHALVEYFADPRAHNPKWRRRNAAMGRAFVYLALFGGLRSGEARGLPVDAIDFDAGTIEVRQQLDHWNRVAPPKTDAGNRVVPMAPPLAAALRDWMQNHHRPSVGGLVFTTVRGTPVCKSNMRTNIWTRALADLGMGEPDDKGRTFHFHALRHFASALMVKHMPLADVPAIMGHAHFDTTLMEYAQPVLTAPAKAAAFEQIGADLVPLLTTSDAPVTQLAA